MSTTHKGELHKNTRLLKMLSKIIGQYLSVDTVILINNERKVDYIVEGDSSDMISSFLELLLKDMPTHRGKDLGIKLYMNDLLTKDKHMDERKHLELIEKVDKVLGKYGYFLAIVKEDSYAEVLFKHKYKFSPGIFPISEKTADNSYYNYILRKMIASKMPVQKKNSKAKADPIVMGIKKPIIWENITFLFTDEGFLKIMQDDTDLGEYDGKSLEIPKGKRNLWSLLVQIILENSNKFNSDSQKFLEYPTDTDSLATLHTKISDLNSSLKKSFGTNKNPIYFGKNEKAYKTLFKSKNSSGLDSKLFIKNRKRSEQI